MEIKVCSLERGMLERLRPLVANYRFKPYTEYRIEERLLASYVMDEISDMLSHEENFAFIAEERGKPVGLVSVERLDWDRKHFSIEMARIHYLVANGGYSKAFGLKCELIAHVLAECRRERISHLAARVYKEDLVSIHALEGKCFRLMDVIVTDFFDLRKKEVVHTANQWHVREFRPNDVRKLRKIAIDSFVKEPVAKQRFHADPYLPREKSDDLYVQWLIESCKGTSDTVLVAEMSGIPVGFSVCKVQMSPSKKLGVRFGTVVLTGVAPSARGRGVHASLLSAALRWFTDKVDIVEVGAEISNYAVQKAWNRLGFKIIRSQCTFHWSPRMEGDHRRLCQP